MRYHPSRLKSLHQGVLVIVVTAAIGLASLPARAQIFAGVTPPPPVPDAPAAKSPAVVLPETVLRPMPSVAASLTISGETGGIRWPVYVTEAQSKGSLRLRIGFLSSVSVLPDASSLTVTVNDRVIGVQALDASQSVKTVEFVIPAGALSAGVNAIAVAIQQRHRVDCSVPATYELWTRIDPRQSGLIVPATLGGIDSLGQLAALAGNPDGLMPIHIVLTGKTNPSHLERLIRATQAIALSGGFNQPAVDFSLPPDSTTGVDLALGTRAALKQVPRLVDHIGASGPLATLIPAPQGGVGRPTIILTGSDDAELDAAITQLSISRPEAGTAAGQLTAANASGHAVVGGESLSLHDLDVKNQQFNGRLFHEGFDLALPSDMLSSDYARGTFDLAGAYTAGLAGDAQVRVEINGQSAGLIKLPNAEGDIFKHNQLFIPLRLMRSGRNHVDIYAETPRAEDATCSAGETRRFLSLDSSVLKIPTLARVLRLPDLGAVTNGGLPFSGGHAHLVVPKPDRDTMAAALSITTRAAVAAGKPIPFSFATMPSDEDGSTLIVAPARALDPATMQKTGLDPANVEAAWHDLAPVSDGTAEHSVLPSRWWLADSEAPLACHLPVRFADPMVPHAAEPKSPAMPTAAAVSTDSDDLLADWTNETKGPTWRDRLSALSMNGMAWVDRLEHRLSSRSVTSSEITPGTSLILAQGFSGRSGTDVTTIVTAPDSATLRGAVTCLFDQRVWPAVHGRLVALDASSGHVTATDATQFRYTSSGHPSLRNLRLVAAGWLSLNPIAFVIISLALAALLAGTTPLFVRGVGRKSK